MSEEAATNTRDFLSNLIEANPDIKAASLYNRFVAALKDPKSIIREKAFPLRKTEKSSKFKLAKASVRAGAKPERLVTDFLVLSVELFNKWVDSERETLRNSNPLKGNSTNRVMPSAQELMDGDYSDEQLQALATHVAEKRYVKRGKRKAKEEAPVKKAKKAAKKKVVEVQDEDEE
jgi:hypothetical protein